MTDWDDLRFVLALAREGTVVQAAAVLDVNQTTVSRRIRNLEESLRTRLFKKLKHGAVLTPVGEEMVRTAEEMEALADELDARIQGLDTRLEGKVRVTAGDFIFERWISDLAEFRHRHPGIELELSTTFRKLDLTRREADVAVRMSAEAPEHLIGRKHVEVFHAVYGSSDLVEAVGAEAPYSAFPWVSWTRGIGGATDRYLAAHAPGAKVAVRIETFGLLTRALRAGMGVSIMPCVIGDAVPDLRRVGPYFEGGFYLWILTHPKLRRSTRVRATIDFLRELIDRDRELLEGRAASRTATGADG